MRTPFEQFEIISLKEIWLETGIKLLRITDINQIIYNYLIKENDLVDSYIDALKEIYICNSFNLDINLTNLILIFIIIVLVAGFFNKEITIIYENLFYFKSPQYTHLFVLIFKFLFLITMVTSLIFLNFDIFLDLFLNIKLFVIKFNFFFYCLYIFLVFSYSILYLYLLYLNFRFYVLIGAVVIKKNYLYNAIILSVIVIYMLFSFQVVYAAEIDPKENVSYSSCWGKIFSTYSNISSFCNYYIDGIKSYYFNSFYKINSATFNEILPIYHDRVVVLNNLKASSVSLVKEMNFENKLHQNSFNENLNVKVIYVPGNLNMESGNINFSDSKLISAKLAVIKNIKHVDEHYNEIHKIHIPNYLAFLKELDKISHNKISKSTEIPTLYKYEGAMQLGRACLIPNKFLNLDKFAVTNGVTNSMYTNSLTRIENDVNDSFFLNSYKKPIDIVHDETTKLCDDINKIPYKNKLTFNDQCLIVSRKKQLEHSIMHLNGLHESYFSNDRYMSKFNTNELLIANLQLKESAALIESIDDEYWNRFSGTENKLKRIKN